MTNDQNYNITTNDSPDSDGFHSVPSYAVKTGTVVTVTAEGGKAVKGTATLFLTEYKAGDWLPSTLNTQVRRINSITSDTLMWIDEAFTTQLAGEKAKNTPDSRWTEITLQPQTGATGTINAAALLAAHQYKFKKDNGYPVNPVAIKVTAGVVEVLLVQ